MSLLFSRFGNRVVWSRDELNHRAVAHHFLVLAVPLFPKSDFIAPFPHAYDRASQVLFLDPKTAAAAAAYVSPSPLPPTPPAPPLSPFPSFPWALCIVISSLVMPTLDESHSLGGKREGEGGGIRYHLRKKV